MLYADYNFYRNTFKGSVDEPTFNSQVVEASFYIKSLTRGNIDEKNIPDVVKMATCSIIGVLAEEKKQNSINSVIASESVGNHSRSYQNKIKSSEEIEKEKLRLAKLYLSGTGLLYQGLGALR